MNEAEVQEVIRDALDHVREGRYMKVGGGITLDPCVVLMRPRGLTDSRHFDNITRHLRRLRMAQAEVKPCST